MRAASAAFERNGLVHFSDFAGSIPGAEARAMKPPLVGVDARPDGGGV